MSTSVSLPAQDTAPRIQLHIRTLSPSPPHCPGTSPLREQGDPSDISWTRGEGMTTGLYSSPLYPSVLCHLFPVLSTTNSSQPVLLPTTTLSSSPHHHLPPTALPSHPKATTSPYSPFSQGQGQVPGGAGSSLVPLSAADSYLPYSKSLPLRDGPGLHPACWDFANHSHCRSWSPACPAACLCPSPYLNLFSATKSQPMHLSGSVSPNIPSKFSTASFSFPSSSLYPQCFPPAGRAHPDGTPFTPCLCWLHPKSRLSGALWARSLCQVPSSPLPVGAHTAAVGVTVP